MQVTQINAARRLKTNYKAGQNQSARELNMKNRRWNGARGEDGIEVIVEDDALIVRGNVGTDYSIYANGFTFDALFHEVTLVNLEVHHADVRVTQADTNATIPTAAGIYYCGISYIPPRGGTPGAIAVLTPSASPADFASTSTLFRVWTFAFERAVASGPLSIARVGHVGLVVLDSKWGPGP